MAFSYAVLLQHDRTRSIFMTPVTFYGLGDLETNWTYWPRDKIQNGGEYLHSHHSSQLSAFVQKTRKLMSR